LPFGSGDVTNRPRDDLFVKSIAALLFVAVIVRLIGFAFPPNIYNDTEGYVRLAQRFQTLRLVGYDGMHTPIYPLLLAMAGLNFRIVTFLQNIMGIATAAMLFSMIYRRTNSAAFALIGGIILCLDVVELGFEQAILTETLATFLLILSAFKLQRMLPGSDAGWQDYAILGALAGLTGLTRPLYVYLAPLYLIFLAIRYRRASIPKAHLAIFGAVAGGLLLGWSFVNWWNVGYFGISTQMGFGLSNQSGPFIELAPDQYAAIRDPYLRARSKQIADTGTHVNTIYRAWPEIRQETGYDDVQLLREVTRMSLQLFASHPILYARGVSRAWLGFWHPPLSHGMPFLGGHFRGIYPGSPSFTWLGRLFNAIQSKEIPLLMALNCVFLLSAVVSILQVLSREMSLDVDQLAIAIVLTASAIQAMVEFGENGRFAVPTFPLVVYTVVITFWQYLPTLSKYG
jgi:hypothetical protein